MTKEKKIIFSHLCTMGTLTHLYNHTTLQLRKQHILLVSLFSVLFPTLSLFILLLVRGICEFAILVVIYHLSCIIIFINSVAVKGHKKAQPETLRKLRTQFKILQYLLLLGPIQRVLFMIPFLHQVIITNQFSHYYYIS